MLASGIYVLKSKCYPIQVLMEGVLWYNSTTPLLRCVYMGFYSKQSVQLIKNLFGQPLTRIAFLSLVAQIKQIRRLHQVFTCLNEHFKKGPIHEILK